LRQSAATFAAAVKSGAVKADIGRRYRLADIVRAHEELENRQTTGAPVLLP
jgi:NADPH2:quinone reductase